MSVPHKVRSEVKDAIWAEADGEHWLHLSDNERSKLYGRWATDPNLGGRLGAYIDPRNVRVYIKDTLLKGYIRARMEDFEPVRAAFSLRADVREIRSFIKPHGKLFENGQMIAWDSARNWKLSLLTLHERVEQTSGATPLGVALFTQGTVFRQPSTRSTVESAFTKLDLGRLVWLD